MNQKQQRFMKCVTACALVLCGVCLGTAGAGEKSATESQSANVIILDKKAIAAYDATTIIELINMLPGINTTESGTLSMGGFSASDIIVSLDGRPINDQTKTSKYINWGEVDYSAIIRIEIHKISSRCSGGEIQIFTEKRGDVAGGRLKAWRGVRDHNGIDASLNKGLGDYFVNVAHNYATEGAHHNNNNDEERTATQVKLALEKRFSLSGSFAYSRDEGGNAVWSYDTPEKTRPPSCDDYVPDPTKARYRERRESYGGVLNLGAGDFRTELFVNDHMKKNWPTGVRRDANGNILYETDAQGNISAIPFKGGNDVNVREYGGKIGMFQSGWEYGLRSVFTSAAFSKTSSRGAVETGEADEYLLDFFGAGHWGGLALSANIYYHDDYGWDVFPKIAYSHQFAPYYLDVSFTATKKYPSFFRKYFSTSSSRANPELDPQTNLCVTLKLGGDHQIGKNRISWQLAPFFNKAYGRFYTHTYFQEDEQGNPVVDPETGKTKVNYTQYANLDEAYWTGGDAILMYDYDRWIGVDGRFTLEYTRDEVHDSSFAYIAPYKFKGRFFLKPLAALTLQLWCTYYSDRWADQDETYQILWYYYLDFKATYQFAKNVDLFMEVKNLTDFDYYVYRGYPGNSRRWWFGMEVKF